MKCPTHLYRELADAIAAVRVPRHSSDERYRWDCLWASGYPVSRLYAAGMNDNHIDTALRHIIAESLS